GARALEEQVLDEVRDARSIDALVAGARADPEADGHRTDARHLLGDDALPGVELRQDVLLHRPILPRRKFFPLAASRMGNALPSRRLHEPLLSRAGPQGRITRSGERDSGSF